MITLSPNPYHFLNEAQCSLEDSFIANPIIKDLILAISFSDLTPPDLKYAYDKFLSPVQRVVIESFILSAATLDVIEKSTSVPCSVIHAYATHIFDGSVFRDRLEKLSFVNQLKEHLEPNEYRFYEAAVTCGPSYLSWLITGESDLKAKEVMRQLMVDSLYRSKEHRMCSASSELTKSARSWAMQAHQIAATIDKQNDEVTAQVVDELRLTLLANDETVNAEKSGLVPSLISH